MAHIIVHLLGEQEESFDDCSASSFCTACVAAVCGQCCTDHLQRHPHEHGVLGGHILQVDHIRGSPAVSALTVKRHRLGYNWNHIQRVGPSFDRWIHLRPAEFYNLGHHHCPCGHHVTTELTLCSPACKLHFEDGGGVRDLVQALVDGDYQTLSSKDRYCSVCELLYSSAHCVDHEAHHDPQVPPGNVITIVQQDGRILIPEEQVPPEMCEGVMRVLHAGDGSWLVALRRREPHHLPPVVDAPFCRHPNCAEQVEVDGHACSIDCR